MSPITGMSGFGGGILLTPKSPSVYTSNLLQQPNFLSTHTVLRSNPYGFDSFGMWINGDSGTNITAYPLRTNINIPANKGFSLKVSIYRNNSCSDHGVCLFKTGTNPRWQWGTNTTRIAFQWNCTTPWLYTNSTSTSTSTTFSSNNVWYSMWMEYNLTTIRVRCWSGFDTFTGSTFLDRSFNNIILSSSISVQAGDTYDIGFDADQDTTTYKSYWRNLTLALT